MGTATQGREASGRARRQRAMADPDGGRTTYSYRILPLTPALSPQCGARDLELTGEGGDRTAAAGSGLTDRAVAPATSSPEAASGRGASSPLRSRPLWRVWPRCARRPR